MLDASSLAGSTTAASDLGQGAIEDFDSAMRAHIADQAGSTLGEAISHWHATRSAAPAAIDAQFELNRFTRQWYLDNPGGRADDLRQAWKTCRLNPTDHRPRA